MKVRHRHGAYPIIFTTLEVARDAVPHDALVVTDSNLAEVYVEHFRPSIPTLVVPAGESSKSIEQYARILNWLSHHKAKRNQPIVAFGGGVIGDLVGFVAGTYMRGVPLIQIPTSLLAMVDSSVGGKVGIDLPQGKNLVGVFKAPDTVYLCEELLETLPEREFRSGVAEVLKYGFIMDAPLAKDLASRPLLPGDDRLASVLRTCIQHKAFIVERDEFETTGLRATLNFGHTLGHAIEVLQGYSDWLHGEAIAVGMVFEAFLAEKLGVAAEGTRDHIEATVTAHRFSSKIPDTLDTDELVELMSLDKKARKRALAFSLVSDIGTCKLVHGVEPDHVRQSLNEFRKS